MSYLRNIASNAVTQDMPSESVIYQTLADLRDPTNSARSLWEDVPEEIAAAAATRAFVVLDPGAATAANETASSAQNPTRPGTITDVRFVANSPGIVGAATNSRTLTVVQGTQPGAGSPARTTLATLALLAGVNAVTGQNSPAFTINNANMIGDVPVEVVSTAVGAGLADPGGLVVVTYTPV